MRLTKILWLEDPVIVHGFPGPEPKDDAKTKPRAARFSTVVEEPPVVEEPAVEEEVAVGEEHLVVEEEYVVAEERPVIENSPAVKEPAVVADPPAAQEISGDDEFPFRRSQAIKKLQGKEKSREVRQPEFTVGPGSILYLHPRWRLRLKLLGLDHCIPRECFDRLVVVSKIHYPEDAPNKPEVHFCIVGSYPMKIRRHHSLHTVGVCSTPTGSCHEPAGDEASCDEPVGDDPSCDPKKKIWCPLLHISDSLFWPNIPPKGNLSIDGHDEANSPGPFHSLLRIYKLPLSLFSPIHYYRGPALPNIPLSSLFMPTESVRRITTYVDHQETYFGDTPVYPPQKPERRSWGGISSTSWSGPRDHLATFFQHFAKAFGVEKEDVKGGEGRKERCWIMSGVQKTKLAKCVCGMVCGCGF